MSRPKCPVTETARPNSRVPAWLYVPLPNSNIKQWRMVVIATGYALFVTSQYDVIFTFANQRFGEVCWHNMHIQGRRSSSNGVEGNGNIKKNKKIATNYVCFCWSTMVTSNIITEIIENHSEFSGCTNSYNKFVSSRSWQTIELPEKQWCWTVPWQG